MATCERQIDVPVPPGTVLTYIADPRNLERFIPGVRSADRTLGGAVDVIEEGNRHVEADLSDDPDRHRIDWSVEGPHGYGGHLNVLPSDQGTLIRAQVNSDRLDADRLRDATDAVLAGLARALVNEAGPAQ